MNQRLFLIVSILILLLLNISIYLYLKTGTQRTNNLKVPITQPVFLFDDEYKVINDELTLITNEQNPKTALQELSKKMATNSAISRSCHPLAHGIGQQAYKKYNDFAESLRYKDEICNSGYMHGVIESVFSSSEDVFSDIKTICSKYPDQKFLAWECYHGVGHGVMYYTNNDLPRSLELCDSLDGKFKISSCVNGVFMENFNTDQKLHPSVYLKKEEPSYPCSQQDPKYKVDCYTYAPTFFLSLNRGEYLKVLKWCNQVEDGYQLVCAHGVGSQTIKENIDNPKMVESLCESDGNFQSSCIKGMVGLYMNHYGNLDEVKKLCPILNKENQTICEEVIKQNEYLFN